MKFSPYCRTRFPNSFSSSSFSVLLLASFTFPRNDKSREEASGMFSPDFEASMYTVLVPLSMTKNLRAKATVRRYLTCGSRVSIFVRSTPRSSILGCTRSQLRQQNDWHQSDCKLWRIRHNTDQSMLVYKIFGKSFKFKKWFMATREKQNMNRSFDQFSIYRYIWRFIITYARTRYSITAQITSWLLSSRYTVHLKL